ncbi:MAG TPA: BPSL0067 family protein [Azospirillaceae bacterium]|nr:BPSL0067 family protein [Azospirillaceae bacterium]
MFQPHRPDPSGAPLRVAAFCDDPIGHALVRTLCQADGLDRRLDAIMRAWTRGEPVVQPVLYAGDGRVHVPEPLPLREILVTGVSPEDVGVVAADGTRYRLHETEAEKRDWFNGLTGTPRRHVPADAVDGLPLALRLVKPYPIHGRRSFMEEADADAMLLQLWQVRLLHAMAAVWHEGFGRGEPLAAGYAFAARLGIGLRRVTEGYPEYNPNQPRNDAGRWTDGGGGGSSPTSFERPGREDLRYLVSPEDAQAGGSRKPVDLGGVPYANPDFRKQTAPVDTGQCVALVQKAAKMPLTKHWKAGVSLQERPEIPPGTVIATMVDGKYPNERTGNHAAYFVRYETQGDREGIIIYDQYIDRDTGKVVGPRERFIAFQPYDPEKKQNRSNNASAYSVVIK